MCEPRPVIVYENKSIRDEYGQHIRYEKVETYKARFLGWGIECYDSCTYTVAIIELSDGHIKLVNPEWFRFTDR